MGEARKRERQREREKETYRDRHGSLLFRCFIFSLIAEHAGLHTYLSFSLSLPLLYRTISHHHEPYSHHATQYHTVPYRSVPYHTLPPCSVRQHYVPTSNRAIPYHTIPHHTIPYHTNTIPYHTISHQTTPSHTTPYPWNHIPGTQICVGFVFQWSHTAPISLLPRYRLALPCYAVPMVCVWGGVPDAGTRRASAGAPQAARGSRCEIGGVERRDQDRPHAHPGCDPAHPRTGVRRVRRAGLVE